MMKPGMEGRRIVIIGSGIGGTALAARLAKAGHSVTVLEKNEFSGGRCSLIHENGYRFDQGPSLLLMKKIFEETFSELGEDFHAHVDLLKCSPNYRLHFHDGTSMDLTTDLPHLISQVERFEGAHPSTSTNLLAFLSETGTHYRYSVAHALKQNFESLGSLIRPQYLPLLWRLNLHDTVWGRASKYFSTDKIRKAFTFQTMYLGMSPFEAPAPYNLLQYTEIAEGIWYPRGGFNRVVSSLEGIAKKHGAKFVYGADVEEILINGRKEATGVRLRKGGLVDGDLVVCNADLVYAYNQLLPETGYGRDLGQYAQLTSSSISFYWSMSSKVDQLTTHNIFIAKDYKPSFDRIFKDHTLPEEPSFYVNVPSRVDPSAAPEGKDSLIVLVPVGHLTGHGDQRTDELVRRARDQVISTLEARLGLTNFRDLILAESVNDPRTWTTKFNLWKGSILGLSHNLSQVLAFRPRTRSPHFRNLYFVGASAQPGTGVPVVLCGAKLVADQIERDLKGWGQEPSSYYILLKLAIVILIGISCMRILGGMILM